MIVDFKVLVKGEQIDQLRVKATARRVVQRHHARFHQERLVAHERARESSRGKLREQVDDQLHEAFAKMNRRRVFHVRRELDEIIDHSQQPRRFPAFSQRHVRFTGVRSLFHRLGFLFQHLRVMLGQRLVLRQLQLQPSRAQLAPQRQRHQRQHHPAHDFILERRERPNHKHHARRLLRRRQRLVRVQRALQHVSKSIRVLSPERPEPVHALTKLFIHRVNHRHDVRSIAIRSISRSQREKPLGVRRRVQHS